MCRASRNSVKSIVPLVMVVFRELVVVVMAIFKVGKDDVGYSGDCDCAGDCDGAVDCGHCRPMLVVAKMMAKVILVVNSNTCYLCQKF